MQSHKMLLEEVEEDFFHLVAIYTSMEEYKLAYILNRHFKLHLKRERRDVDFNFKEFQAIFALYSYKDPITSINFNLVANKFKGKPKRILSSGSLFLEEEVRPQEVHLIPEYKGADYFLKIGEEMTVKQFRRFFNKIGQLSNVQAAYEVEVDQLKSKQNLIFE